MARERIDELFVKFLNVINHFNIGGTEVTATADELNTLDGITSSVSELNILDGVTATAAEINTVDLSAVGGALKVVEIPLVAAASLTGAEQDSGVDIPAKSVILEVFVDVTTLGYWDYQNSRRWSTLF